MKYGDFKLHAQGHTASKSQPSSSIYLRTLNQILGGQCSVMAIKKCKMGNFISLSLTSFLATLFPTPNNFSVFHNFFLMSNNLTQLSCFPKYH